MTPQVSIDSLFAQVCDLELSRRHWIDTCVAINESYVELVERTHFLERTITHQMNEADHQQQVNTALLATVKELQTVVYEMSRLCAVKESR